MEKSHNKMHVMHLFLPGCHPYCLLSAAWDLPLEDICQFSLAVLD